ncbi:MAG: hypothetical protein AAF704_16335 [Cyanobacteria bacterium P01_D01_bin.123]
MSVTKDTSLQELAVLASAALESAGIRAVLSGGAAVSIYSDNAYESADLDFITSEGRKELAAAIGQLGFVSVGRSRMFEHPESNWYIEFPPGPLGFRNTYVDANEIPLLQTPYGQL